MVGAINPPATGNTFEAFLTSAKAFNETINVRLVPLHSHKREKKHNVFFEQQGKGGLVGVGASASAFPGPITGGVSYYGGTQTLAPSNSPTSTQTTATTSSGSNSSGSAPNLNNAASSLEVGYLLTILGALLGGYLALA